jgi:peptidoglycan hydrolase FlgJ
MRIDPKIGSANAQEKPAQVNPSQANPNQANALDFKQFATLRRASADDPKALREVARQFESIFTKMMLEGMRNASFGDPLFGSDQSDMYQGMMDDQMAVQLSSGRGIGLADMLFRQLSHGAPGAQAALDGGSGSATIDDEQRRNFVTQMQPHAEAAARELGVDARSVIAQAALETGWGTSQPGGAGASHNYFGIKAGASWQGARVAADTTEFAHGVAGSERAEFRAYGSVAENMGDYVRLLRDNPRYSAALNTGTDVHAFGTALQKGGYATDPAYADKLAAVAAKLTSLNVKSFKSDTVSPIQTARTVEGNG